MPKKIIAANKMKESQSIDTTPCPHILAIIEKLQASGVHIEVIGEVLDLIDYSFAERVSKKT